MHLCAWNRRRASSLRRGEARINGANRLVVAWDVNQDTLDGIKAGTIDSTVAQKPYTMGYVGLKALDEVFHNPPAQLSKDYEHRLLLAVPGVRGYGHFAGGQEQCGYLYCGSGHAKVTERGDGKLRGRERNGVLG